MSPVDRRPVLWGRHHIGVSPPVPRFARLASVLQDAFPAVVFHLMSRTIGLRRRDRHRARLLFAGPRHHPAQHDLDVGEATALQAARRLVAHEGTT